MGTATTPGHLEVHCQQWRPQGKSWGPQNMAASKHFIMHPNDHVKGNESGKERAALWYIPGESLGQ